MTKSKMREQLGLMMAYASIAAQSISKSSDDPILIENPYKDLPLTTFSGSTQIRKSNLTPKQKKNRNKAKLARKSRKQNR
jgi:hypothetical protein